MEILLVGFGLLFGLAVFAFWIWMLVDCLRSDRLSKEDRLVWVLVLVFLQPIGAALYYFIKYRAP